MSADFSGRCIRLTASAGVHSVAQSVSNDRKTPRHLQDAIARNRETAAAKPLSAVAEHNLASALGNAQYWREALIHIRSAFRKGTDAPESWLVLARA